LWWREISEGSILVSDEEFSFEVHFFKRCLIKHEILISFFELLLTEKQGSKSSSYSSHETSGD